MDRPEKIKVAVKSDDIVMRDPKTRERITTAGKKVSNTSFWRRRIKAGDVIKIEDKVKDEPKTILEREGVNHDDIIQ